MWNVWMQPTAISTGWIDNESCRVVLCAILVCKQSPPLFVKVHEYSKAFCSGGQKRKKRVKRSEVRVLLGWRWLIHVSRNPRFGHEFNHSWHQSHVVTNLGHLANYNLLKTDLRNRRFIPTHANMVQFWGKPAIPACHLPGGYVSQRSWRICRSEVRVVATVMDFCPFHTLGMKQLNPKKRFRLVPNGPQFLDL